MIRPRLRKAAMLPREEEPAVMLNSGGAIVPVEKVAPVGVQSLPELPQLPSIEPPPPSSQQQQQQQQPEPPVAAPVQPQASLFRRMKYPAASNRSAIRRM